MNGTYRDRAGPAVDRLTNLLHRHAISAGRHRAHFVTAFSKQEPGKVVRGELILCDDDVLTELR
jgi:hypothetical protein